LPILPERYIPYVVDVYQVFHFGDKQTIGSRIVHKGKFLLTSYNEGNFNHVQDKVHIVLEFAATPYKCKTISDKLINFGYHQTMFNFQNLLSSLDFVIKTTTKKSHNSNISSWFEDDKSSFVDLKKIRKIHRKHTIAIVCQKN